jgi:hypothetical protein
LADAVQFPLLHWHYPTRQCRSGHDVSTVSSLQFLSPSHFQNHGMYLSSLPPQRCVQLGMQVFLSCGDRIN